MDNLSLVHLLYFGFFVVHYTNLYHNYDHFNTLIELLNTHLFEDAPVTLSKGNAIKESYAVQPKDVRLLSYKMLIDKFNDKYDGLNQRQKNVLREYINNVTNTVALKEFVQSEIPVIQKELKRAATRVGSKVVKIKLNEVNNMLTKINEASIVRDKDVLTMLRYYELIKELKNVETK